MANGVLRFRWRSVLAAVLASVAAVSYLLGVAAGPGEGGIGLRIAAAVLLAGAIMSVVWAGVAGLRRRSVRRELNMYSCPRCGYAPSLEDLETKPATPCPRCGEPVYGEVL